MWALPRDFHVQPERGRHYYNPAYLLAIRGQSCRWHSTAGRLEASGPDRSGDVLSDSPTQQVLAGFKANAIALTRFDHPASVMAGIEKFGRAVVLQLGNLQPGSVFQYDRQPLFLNIGGVPSLARLSGGFATRTPRTRRP